MVDSWWLFVFFFFLYELPIWVLFFFLRTTIEWVMSVFTTVDAYKGQQQGKPYTKVNNKMSTLLLLCHCVLWFHCLRQVLQTWENKWQRLQLELSSCDSLNFTEVILVIQRKRKTIQKCRPSMIQSFNERVIYFVQQQVMGGSGFLQGLLTFNKDSINGETVELLEPYLRMEDYNLETAKKVCKKLVICGHDISSLQPHYSL